MLHLSLSISNYVTLDYSVMLLLFFVVPSISLSKILPNLLYSDSCNLPMKACFISNALEHNSLFRSLTMLCFIKASNLWLHWLFSACCFCESLTISLRDAVAFARVINKWHDHFSKERQWSLLGFLTHH